jgi:hypothetical protein
MKRRIVGLDLNGRFDLAARDWREDEDAVGPLESEIVHGGTCAAVVMTRNNRLIAGPQAVLAPHGRGKGWGEIGDPSRRRPLAEALDRGAQDQADAEAVEAAVYALARESAEVVVAVPDLADFGEAEQGAMIAAMSARHRRVRLLWRPVAIFLDLLRTGWISPEAAGARFRLLMHVGAGIEDQVLTLRTDPDHPGHLAPQRDGPGQLCAPEAGLDALFDRARHAVRARNASVDWAHCEPSRLGPALLTGDAAPGDIEVLRAWNATWTAVAAQDLAQEYPGLSDVDLRPANALVAATFLVTPLAGRVAETLGQAVTRSVGPLTLVGPEAVARGCLRAGRLIERGLPHYFDRLEPVAIAVLRGDTPEFEHLIPPGAVVPANREYVSREIGGFVWRQGKADTEFYIRKGDSEVRHWVVTKPPGPPENVPVTLRIRQTPGQSWARLTVGSAEWEALSRSPIALDWETLTPLDLTPDEVLEKLRTPPPTVPERIVGRPHIDLWNGAYWTGDGRPSELACAAFGGGSALPGRWASVLSRSRRHPDPPNERFWLVGTDGDLPNSLDAQVREGFLAALNQMAQQVCAATLRHPPRDNNLLKALTWCFALCPEAAQDRILDALEANAQGRRHPLSEPSHAVRVLRQGAGRAVSGVPRLTRLFRYLEQAPLNNDTINALAMALTRRAEAPEALTRDQVDEFLRRLGLELLDQIVRRSFRLRFRNTLSAIAGLFRWRLREPYALLAGRDPVAADLRANLVRAKDMLMNLRYRNDSQRDKKIAQIEAIIEYLDGRGDPNILELIEKEDEE